MASVAAANPTLPPPSSSHGGGGEGGINIEALKQININHFSQSELQALSLSSDSAFDLHRTDDVVSPELDRSVFNESTGSRRQTYSRLHHRSHSRFPGLHSSLKPQRQLKPCSDAVTHSIVHFFKHFLNGNHDPPPPPPPPPPQEEVPARGKGLGLLGLRDTGLKLKRKRVRKSKDLSLKRIIESGVGVELQKVNSKGELVNFAELEEKGDELYTEELIKRTEGLDTEDAVLGYLWSLDGQWGSRRRRRKYVDASLFGDALPVGWKLLLGLRRRDYRVSVYCRRYISPTGQHLASCREVASFLKSCFGGDNADKQNDHNGCSTRQAGVFSSVKNELPADKSKNSVHDMGAHPTFARSSSNAHKNDDSLIGIESLSEVKVQDSFECVNCNLTFAEKNLYLQHLFQYHQRTTKRYKFGTRVGDGVIIKDGKFECQFCHKVFEEWRKYSGHVGNHVRNAGKIPIKQPTPVVADNTSNKLPSPVIADNTSNKLPSPVIADKTSNKLPIPVIADKTSNKLPTPVITDKTSNKLRTPVLAGKTAESPLQEDLPASSSKMDALIEIAQSSSICESPNAGTSKQDLTKQSAEESNIEESPAANNDHEEDLSSDFTGSKTRDDKGDIDPSENLNHGSQSIMENDDMVINDYKWNIDMNRDADCLHDSEQYGNINLEMNLGSNAHLEDTPGLNVEDIVFQDGGSSVPLAQSFEFFPSFNSASHKVEHEFSVVDQKLENVTGFEEMSFDDMEPFKYGFVSGQELPSLPGCSMNLGNVGRIEDGFNSSVRFHSEEAMLNSMDTNQLTVCVWCRTEFRLEGIESETPSDSIGYMCPTCKAKISGHFGGGLSMDSHGF